MAGLCLVCARTAYNSSVQQDDGGGDLVAQHDVIGTRCNA